MPRRFKKKRAMQSKQSRQVKTAFAAALPVILGYIPLGVSCGILSAKAGLLPVQVLLLSTLLYAGGGQFMIASMSMAGISPLSTALSVVLMNARHMLYSSASSGYLTIKDKRAAFFYCAQMTDESFGVNHQQFISGNWSVQQARLVNMFSHSCWIVSNMIGVLTGAMLTIALPVVAFSMTSMFLCLLCMQQRTKRNMVAALFAAMAVVIFKSLGLTQVAVLLGSLVGIAAGILLNKKREGLHEVA